MEKIGRNDPCPCGSGKKYKKCCLIKQGDQGGEFLWYKLRRTEGELTGRLLEFACTRYGEDFLLEAWDEFTLWEDVPFEPGTDPEFENTFLT
ncbi:MAG TPA: SEC-C metal-binding domain-containing protein, partial [Thermodesulfobacteriota bacterium]|nr:SEC-C metal-binding domain-containing protein [Thermodesulfobacteriota bacterium]